MITFSSFIAILLMGVALSMDANSVSIVYGMMNRPFKWKNVLVPSACFGVAQAVMPCMGWLGGELVQAYVSAIDHWIAFGLLLAVGVKFIVDSQNDDDESPSHILRLGPLLLASFATSIDACVVGVSINLAGDPLVFSAVVIGIVTFLASAAFSLIGSKIGEKLGHKFGKKLLIVGGVVLIGIGAKILISDLFFS